jgi:hypothetical protein
MGAFLCYKKIRALADLPQKKKGLICWDCNHLLDAFVLQYCEILMNFFCTFIYFLLQNVPLCWKFSLLTLTEVSRTVEVLT